jgi:hypothetical protein
VIVRMFRTGGFPPSANEKVVTVEDGRLAIWRSTDVQAAGSFVGQLSVAESDAIQALARLCVEAGDLTHPPAPDAAIDTVMLDGARAEVSHLDRPDGPWGELLDALRPMLERTDQPYAAIGLEVSRAGDSAALRHLGESVLRVDLSTLRVEARGQAPTREGAGWWDGESGGPGGAVEAGPGWSYELPFDHGLASGSGVVTARVSLVIYERDHPVDVALVATSTSQPRVAGPPE